MPTTDRKKPPDRGGQGTNHVGYKTSTAAQTDLPMPRCLQSNRGRCGWKTVALLSIATVVLAVVASRVASNIMIDRLVLEEMKLSIGEEGVSIFEAYDRDGDGYLSVIEFEPLLERLNFEDTTERGDFKYGDEDIDPSDEVLTVEAAFQPLLQETMSKAKDKSFLSTKSSLVTLDAWTTPNERVTAFPARAFRPFLPEDDAGVGKPYFIIKSKLSMFTSQLSSNRYYPPRVKAGEVIIHRLLSVFHPRPFVHSRFGPQGTVAVIRASNAEYIDVVFRIHAEFQLNEPPSHPFWFTPAQFTGNLIMKRDASHIEHFHMYVPANKSLNVDMEWMNGPNEVEHMEVDIGFMPKMELTIPNPSSQVTIYSESGDVIYEPDSQPDAGAAGQDPIRWTDEISLEEALDLLEVELYPFKKVSYLPLNEAFKKAQTDNKLVHHILLWGALDDQSC